MTGLIGLSALQVALGISVLGIVLLFAGGSTRPGARLRAHGDSARALGFAAVYVSCALVTVSTIAMLYALVTHDFSVAYVAQVGSRATPLLFTIISLWGALEGSILFWAFLLYAFAATAVYMHRHDDAQTPRYAAATLLAVGVFFLVLLVGPANPFGVVSPAPLDGPGPNPLLQNHILMAVHPPLLYLGYVGFAVPFAFAVGAMISGEVATDEWIRSARAWTIASWIFLSAAIIAGMWWSYEVLGWGGYWAWDPVENASFMPWLTATAFMHTIMVQQRRKMLRVWNLNLVVATFVLTVLGTFLTRSGILSSVHAFTRGAIGYFFLGFIALVLVVSLALVAGTAPELRRKGALDDVLCRETVFVIGNLVLSVITFTVLLGTLFPLVAEAVRGVKVSVGAPFFNRMALPAMVALIFLMGVGPALPWRRTDRARFKQEMVAPLAAFALVLGTALAAGARDPYALLAFSLGAFALVANIEQFWYGTRARHAARTDEGWALALARLVGANRHRYGGYIAHIGVLACAVGIAASSAFKTEREVTLTPGQTVRVRDVTVRLDQVWGRQEPSRATIGADVSIVQGSRVVAKLEPSQHFYPSNDQPVPTPAVRSTAARDVYVNLMAFAENGSSATIRVLVEPLVVWIWVGGGIVCLGALVGLWPRERRSPEAAVVAQTNPTLPARKRGKRRAIAEVVT